MLKECLESIASADRRGFVLQRVVVVDNASSDGSADDIKVSGVPLVIIRNTRNVGFAAGCNIGAKGSSAEYLLFLNPDTRLQAESLCDLIGFLQEPRNSGIGAAGIQLVDSKGDVSRSCARDPSVGRLLLRIFGISYLLPDVLPDMHMTEWDHLSSREVDHVIGAFYLVRAGLFFHLGMFDERFFLYLEDIDLSLRIRQSGHKVYYFSQSQAYHREGGSSDKIRGTRLFYSLRSRILLARKHFTAPEAMLVTAATLLVEPLPRIALSVVKFSPGRMSETIGGFARLWMWLLADKYKNITGVIRRKANKANSDRGSKTH